MSASADKLEKLRGLKEQIKAHKALSADVEEKDKKAFDRLLSWMDARVDDACTLYAKGIPDHGRGRAHQPPTPEARPAESGRIK
jgi:hypothetical protein